MIGRQSIDSRRVSQDTRRSDIMSVRTQQRAAPPIEPKENHSVDGPLQDVAAPIPITITPATPAPTSEDATPRNSTATAHEPNGEKRSVSLDEKDRDVSRGKKVREVLKDRVHKGQATITTISKKIGHNVGRHSNLNLKRTSSAPGNALPYLSELLK